MTLSTDNKAFFFFGFQICDTWYIRSYANVKLCVPQSADHRKHKADRVWMEVTEINERRNSQGCRPRILRCGLTSLAWLEIFFFFNHFPENAPWSFALCMLLTANHANIYLSKTPWASPIVQQNQWRGAKTVVTFSQHGILNMKGQLAWLVGGRVAPRSSTQQTKIL